MSFFGDSTIKKPVPETGRGGADTGFVSLAGRWTKLEEVGEQICTSITPCCLRYKKVPLFTGKRLYLTKTVYLLLYSLHQEARCSQRRWVGQSVPLSVLSKATKRWMSGYSIMTRHTINPIFSLPFLNGSELTRMHR